MKVRIKQPLNWAKTYKHIFFETLRTQSVNRESDGEVGWSGEDCLSVVLNKDWIYNNIASTPRPLSPPSHNILQLLAPGSAL